MQTQLSPELEAFVKLQAKGVGVLSPDAFFEMAGAIVRDEATKDAVRNAWLLHLAEQADAEGGEVSLDDALACIAKSVDEHHGKSG